MRLRPAAFPAFPLRGAQSLAAALLLWSGAAVAGDSKAVRASYDVYFGGFHALNAEAYLENGAERYRITAEAETQGFVSWFLTWRGTTESQGRITAGSVIPELHENWGTADEGERLVSLHYDAAGNIVETVAEPEQDWEGRHPLPPNAGKGTLDPLSVIAGLDQLLRNGGACEGSFSVFDGRKRYDLIVADAGVTRLEPNNYSIYDGEARGCRLDYEMLGGHRIERNKYAATARERIVWVARPSADAPLIPVRLSIETAYGRVMGHLTGYSVDGETAAPLTD